jgi:hypothetical protein
MGLEVGDKVRLTGSAPSLLAMGSLNSYFLDEEGVTWGLFVPVVKAGPRSGEYIVQLPSGYMLGISDRDILETQKAGAAA